MDEVFRKLCESRGRVEGVDKAIPVDDFGRTIKGFVTKRTASAQNI
jgi:hypothetical protein